MLVRKRQCYLFVSLFLSQNKDRTAAVVQSLEQTHTKKWMYLFQPCVWVWKILGLCQPFTFCCHSPGSCIPWATPFYYTVQGPQISALHQQNSLHSWLWDRYCSENKIFAEQLLIQSKNSGWLQISTSRVLYLTQGLIAGPWFYFLLFILYFSSQPVPPAELPQLCTQWAPNSRYLWVDFLLSC